MLWPLYICESCGKYGGMGLVMSQDLAKVARGEKVDSSPHGPDCPDGHGPMRQVAEDDLLQIISAKEDEGKSERIR